MECTKCLWQDNFQTGPSSWLLLYLTFNKVETQDFCSFLWRCEHISIQSYYSAIISVKNDTSWQQQHMAGHKLGPRRLWCTPLVRPFGAHRETGFQGGAGSRSNRFQKHIAASTANLCHPHCPPPALLGDELRDSWVAPGTRRPAHHQICHYPPIWPSPRSGSCWGGDQRKKRLGRCSLETCPTHPFWSLVTNYCSGNKFTHPLHPLWYVVN